MDPMVAESTVAPGVRPTDFAAGGKGGLERFFRSVPLLSLARPYSSVVTVGSGDALSHALAVLAHHHFISAPVLDSQSRIAGMVSVNDLAAALVTIADAAAKETGLDTQMDASHLEDLARRIQSLWKAHTTQQIMNISDRSATVTVPHSASVWDALLILGRDGAHGVVVMNADGTQPEAFFSQGALVNYLFHHLQHFSSIARLMVQQISSYSQVGSPRPVQVADDAPLLEAFRLIRDQGVTGVMVVSHGRTLVGVISASDVKMMGPNLEDLAALFRSTGDFVGHTQHKNKILISKVVSCTPVDTVGMVMEKMLDNDVHRVFVVRTHHGMEHEVPLDVLALRDILLLFCPE